MDSQAELLALLPKLSLQAKRRGLYPLEYLVVCVLDLEKQGIVALGQLDLLWVDTAPLQDALASVQDLREDGKAVVVEVVGCGKVGLDFGLVGELDGVCVDELEEALAVRHDIPLAHGRNLALAAAQNGAAAVERDARRELLEADLARDLQARQLGSSDDSEGFASVERKAVKVYLETDVRSRQGAPELGLQPWR